MLHASRACRDGGYDVAARLPIAAPSSTSFAGALLSWAPIKLFAPGAICSNAATLHASAASRTGSQLHRPLHRAKHRAPHRAPPAPPCSSKLWAAHRSNTVASAGCRLVAYPKPPDGARQLVLFIRPCPAEAAEHVQGARTAAHRSRLHLSRSD